MPTQSCTLSISPLLEELIVYLTQQDQNYASDSDIAKLVDVLLNQLIQMPTEQFDFPIPAEPRLHYIAQALLKHPDDRRTIQAWGEKLAISERTLARLVKQHVGLSFGQWRKQLHLVVALQKLSSGESVQRVSEDLGYESISAFITFFKKALGTSPKKYIKERQLI